MKHLHIAVLRRPAVAAALACVCVGSSAWASEPETTPPAQPAQPSSASETFLDRLAGDQPLFMVQNGDSFDWTGFYAGVLKDPRGRIFAINSREGEELLTFGALGQFRGVVGYYEPFGGADDEEFETAFEFARLQTYLRGRIPGTNVGYFMNVEYSDGSASLADAYGVWAPEDGIGIRAGQYRNYISQEWLSWEGDLLAADRSLAHYMLMGDDRVQGVSALFRGGDNFRGEVGIHDGFFTANSPFLPFDDDQHIGFSGRFELLMEGGWGDYNMFASGMEGTFMALGFGGGLSWSDGDDRQGRLTADLTWRQERMAVFAAVHANPNRTAGEDTLDMGAVAQIGFMASDTVEPFVRGSIVILDDEFLPADFEDTYYEVTGGANWYPFANLRNRFRITTEASILPNGSPIDIGQGNYIGTDELVIVGRVQGELKL